MAMEITDDCINCGACASECPVEAIYEPGENWVFNKKSFQALSNEHFFIVTKICNSCIGLNEIRCIAICPMNAIKEINL